MTNASVKREWCSVRHLGDVSRSAEFRFKEGDDATRTKEDKRRERTEGIKMAEDEEMRQKYMTE